MSVIVILLCLASDILTTIQAVNEGSLRQNTGLGKPRSTLKLSKEEIAADAKMTSNLRTMMGMDMATKDYNGPSMTKSECKAKMSTCVVIMPDRRDALRA